MIFMIVGFVVLAALALFFGYRSMIRLCKQLRSEGRTVASVFVFVTVLAQLVLTLWAIFG